jgi:5-methylcytosine-specific restriction endonuclease McrA
MAPSLDHILPLARGGAHDHSNLQLAHRICNSRKSDKGTDQLLLFG